MTARLWIALALSATGLGAVTRVSGCVHGENWVRPSPSTNTAALAASVGPHESNLDTAHPLPPRGPHPRILLTADRLAAMRKLRDAGAPAWKLLAARCDDVVGPPIESGYEAWDWANATLDLALCHAVTGRPDQARAAVRYFRAMLDDHTRVGDGAGGSDAVQHDDGYPIRTRGCLAAIAYDWLHDVPGMTGELRNHAADRFVTWTKWFGESGYNRDQPIGNYYMGWFGAVAFGAIALDGDDPRAASLGRDARRMFGSEIAPAYTRKLAGGDFPEGWQYGDLVGAVLAIYADAESRPGALHSPFDQLPWLHQSVAYRAQALLPDGKHMFDTGDWSVKPAVAPPHALMALAAVLSSGDPAERHARSLAHLAQDPDEEWLWLAALATDPSRPAEDARSGPTSYLSPGTGTVIARTDWSPNAVWVGFASAPSLSDHQHLDAGHFEIVRGSDALIVDAGGYGSYSGLSHNVLAIDDQKENDNYSPNQGTWSDDAGIARFEDGGRFVYALAEYAGAYNPAGYPKDHPERSVTRAERELVFSRAPVRGMGPESARVVVYDRVTLTKPTYGATFLLHGGSAPEGEDGGVRFVVGHSAAFATTLLPGGAPPAVVHEPTNLGDGPYYANEPPEGTTSTRVEVRSPVGSGERRFLHAFVVAGDGARPIAPIRIEGDGVDGVAIDDEAYVFERAGVQSLKATPLAYRAPSAAVRHVIASLAPGASYAVSVERDGDACNVSLRPGAGRRASYAGIVSIDVGPGCSLPDGK